MILNLDPQFNPFPNQKSIEFKSFLFSGGEPHIKIENNFNTSDTITVTHRLQSFNDVGLLLITVDALKRMAVKTIKVFIPYFPAARQDRLMVPGESLSVKVYAELINNLQLNEVIVYDPHSEVTPALLHNCSTITNYTFIQKVISILNNNVLLISPDGGALKKIYKVAEYLGGKEVIECSKTRDVKTGKLSGFKVYADDLQGKDCLVVDDICDGGGTFNGLAQELKNKNAGNLYLAVSHGIFSKGLESLSSYYSGIFTTDSFNSIEEQPKVTQIPLATILQ
ncbi:phosphoribosylpyrophosphate synthetase [Cellulophaga lytica]|uniref:ribose-phosphate diphosphokinase n=1 Tax=Cellulophaga lytica TaxID=979 RepID=UPI0004F7C752|nr:ribose-phosphate diphosphokinase [Cellulophaga lytica]AIM60531.1 phosphoribosylpyrophosphate synthetase [Cellulophaga lytica]